MMELVPAQLEDGWQYMEGLISPNFIYPKEWGMPALESDVHYKIWFKDKSHQRVSKALAISLEQGISVMQKHGIE